MKSFFKYLLATIVGVLLSFLLIFLIMMGIAGSMVSSADKAVEVKDNSILYMDLKNEIVDRASSNPFETLDLATFEPQKNLGLNADTKSNCQGKG
jgi:hypothetical protein